MRNAMRVFGWLALLGAITGLAADQVAAVAQLRRTALSSGGSTATVGSIRLRSTITQTAVLHSTIGPYELRSGFWTGIRQVGTGVQTVIDVPAAFELSQSWPNPFRNATSVRFGVPAGGGKIRLRVFDVTGRRIRTLLDADSPPGWHVVTWDGRDEGGTQVATGVYFCVLETPTGRHHRRMTALR